MRPNDFAEWVDEGGGFSRKRLNREFLDEIRRGLPSDISDDDIAHALIDLLVDDLPRDEEYDGLLDNSETGAVIRCLRAVLRRLGIECQLPFHDKADFWSIPPFSTEAFAPMREALALHEGNDSGRGLRGLRGELRNLVFGATYKPEIVLRDVASGTIEITKNKEHCLLYDRPVGAPGLTWGELVDWWKHQDGNYALSAQELHARLHKRLAISLNSPEELLLNSYWQFCVNQGFAGLPALLPQVYLHHDPLTRRQREQRMEGQVLERQRMDFLVLAPGGRRYVLEVDGKHHYSRDDGMAAPDLYANMVREDRRIRLQGYEMYRFGGAEFSDKQAAEATLNEFFAELLEV